MDAHWSTYYSVWFISCFTDEKSVEEWLRFYMKERNCFAFAWKKEMGTGFFAWWIISVDQYVMAVCGPVQVDRKENTCFCIALFCTTRFVMLNCGLFSRREFERFQSRHWSQALAIVLYADVDTPSVTSLCVDGLKALRHVKRVLTFAPVLWHHYDLIITVKGRCFHNVIGMCADVYTCIVTSLCVDD